MQMNELIPGLLSTACVMMQGEVGDSSPQVPYLIASWPLTVWR